MLTTIHVCIAAIALPFVHAPTTGRVAATPDLVIVFRAAAARIIGFGVWIVTVFEMTTFYESRFILPGGTVDPVMLVIIISFALHSNEFKGIISMFCQR